MARQQSNSLMSPDGARTPYWTFAWTRWGTRCSALVLGDTVVRAIDGFSRIDAEDIVELLPQRQNSVGFIHDNSI